MARWAKFFAVATIFVIFVLDGMLVWAVVFVRDILQAHELSLRAT
jgi:hypothetical protein